MKTVKISVVATLATSVAWWFRLPQAILPAHPYLAAFVMTLVLCIVLRVVWSNSKSESKRQATVQSDVKNSESK